MLKLGFEKIPDVLNGNWASASLTGKNRNRSGVHSNSGRSFQPPANQIRDYLTQTFCPFLSKMFRDAQNVFIDIDSGAHDSRLAS